MAAETIVEPAEEVKGVKEKKDASSPEEKESIKDIEKRARKPPADGPCKGCGKNLPLNRLMLCFHCWVIKNIEDWAKSQGKDFIPTIDRHPDWCHCGLPEHGGSSHGGN